MQGVRLAYIARLRETEGGRGGSQQESLAAAKTEEAQVRTALNRLAYNEKLATLVLADDVLFAIQQINPPSWVQTMMGLFLLINNNWRNIMTDKTKIHSLVTKATKENEDVICTLKSLLEQAESGKIQGICFATLNLCRFENNNNMIGEYGITGLIDTVAMYELIADMTKVADEAAIKAC